nr:U32 family peptidase [Lachnospiraceae bacterium]
MNDIVKFDNNDIEILAPAGSFETLKAAINAGADAIYMGGKSFGARAFANNFSDEEVLKAIDYVHLYGKKMYMTVNTLLYENEISGLYDYLESFYLQGLDAVIVQDMGVVDFIHKHFPSLPIHLSTQTTITTGKNDALFSGYNVTRLVPARELSLYELKRLCIDTDMEVEVFIHGALCYSFSGQCLLSSFRGGRSGNRGKCAGSCRLPYKTSKGEKHILSLKENCALTQFGELINAGAMSFKIEGRMKKPEYVAYITHIYRKYADIYKSLGYEGYKDYINKNEKELSNDIRSMMDLYNREGFTCAYLTNDYKSGSNSPADMLALKRPNHGGVLVGKVIGVNKDNYYNNKKNKENN